MKNLIHHSRLTTLWAQRNGYLVLASGLLLLSLMLSGLCFYLSKRDHVVLVPPQIDRSFWVSKDHVSAEYLSEMAAFFAYLRFNMTPESADIQRRLLLRYIDPRYYGLLNDALVAERDHLTSQHISTAFYPADIQVDQKNLNVQMTGDLVANVGNNVLAPERVTYRIQFHYNNGRLLVTQFDEVKTEVKPHA